MNMVLEQACEMWTEMPKSSSTGAFEGTPEAIPWDSPKAATLIASQSRILPRTVMWFFLFRSFQPAHSWCTDRRRLRNSSVNVIPDSNGTTPGRKRSTRHICT